VNKTIDYDTAYLRRRIRYDMEKIVPSEEASPAKRRKGTI
jgi:hypothetical protein